MSQDRRTLSALAALLPAGTLGLSVTLAAADAKAVATVDPEQRLAWWGNGLLNGGWGNGGWGNGGWHNWGNGWHNGGWGNGLLPFIFGSPWGNGWHNWGNGWRNW